MVENRELEQLGFEIGRAGRYLVSRGLLSAPGGNISARIGDQVAITRSGSWLDRIEPDDLSILDPDGTVVGGAPVPSSEYRLHLRTYETRTDVTAIVRAHPQIVVLVDALGERIRPLTLDQISYLGREMPRIDFYPNQSEELAEEAARASRDADAIVMAYHGCSCLGDSIDIALRRALNLEEAALATYRSLIASHPGLCFPEDLDPLSGHAPTT